MATRKRVKAHQNLYQRTWKQFNTVIKELGKWLLRSLLVMSRRARLSKSGFVMPTVIMVSLVVVLLTTALMLRSFDRSSNASNVRVNEAVLNAATPALDRARVKIEQLFIDPTLPQTTPSDVALDKALTSSRYIFGDETRLKLVHDIDKSSTTQADTILENNESLTTAWKFPVDTDNNGKFDSYTLYGIYFRSPTRDADGNFNRARNPLEARIPPMGEGEVSGRCADVLNTSTSLVGDSDWYKSSNKLTKSFFVYTANVPITEIGGLNREQYEQYKGNRGFSALEFQQDRVRIPINNNTVWYEDDIEISNATTFRLNGRVFTNSNLMVAGKNFSNRTIFYEVSDPNSCYYDQENSKIVVGGNVANGDVQLTIDEGQVEVHRFQGKGIAPAGQDNIDDGINSTNKTTTQAGGKGVGYDKKAYSQRLGLMTQAALDLHPTGIEEPTIDSVSSVIRYPQEVKERFKQRFNDPNETKEKWKILTEELETYFKKHTRRVPYAEVGASAGTEALGIYNRSNVLGYTNPIRPPDTWMTIEDPAIGSTTNYTNLALNFSYNNTMNLRATEPTQQQKDGKEYFIGDRILTGNNLPFFWPKYTTDGVYDKSFDKFAEPQEKQPVKNGNSPVYWNNPNNGNAADVQRTRQSQIQFLPDLGSVERDGFWETEAARQPVNNANTGGLRVVTGTGIYIDGLATTSGGTGVRNPDPSKSAESFLPPPALNLGVIEPPKFVTDAFTTNNDNIIVWPDSMPMSDVLPMQNGSTKKGDLQMRVTAVYHHRHSASTTDPSRVDLNQVPIAFVSSYYDPTTAKTARNQRGLPDVSGIFDTNGNGSINSGDKLADGSTPSDFGSNDGNSNNGVTYAPPYTSDAGRISAVNTYRDKLNRQARAIFPNGRIVNEALRKALTKLDDIDSKPRSLADNAAIDTAICALKILDGTLTYQSSPNIPHGAIKEAAFIDGRQVKSLNSYLNPDLTLDNTKIAETPDKLTDSYTLSLEQRQPLEIRVTELDLNLLKNKEIRRQEIGVAINDNNNDPANEQEYLLPNSGIIYATRDDALPDLSDSSDDIATKELVSPTDFKLDPTRRPNGIRLMNGANLARKNFYRVAEKGLILATNLPVYIKGDFNLHEDPSPSNSTVREEFTDKLEPDWQDFYARADSPDLNFACRQYQPGCADTGDQWRPATIISDAQTLLSNNFWDGFRNQGDYDLNNNQGNTAVNNRLKNGFWNNNFATSADWVGADGFPDYKNRNSYLTNGVTPIQRRVRSPEYVMEICRKLPVSECKTGDWVIGYDDDDDGVLEDSEKEQRASAILQAKPKAEQLGAGTTARPALQPADRRYARRVAFSRNDSNTLALTDTQVGIDFFRTPKPLGISPNNQVVEVKYSLLVNNPDLPRLVDNALWFRTTNNTGGRPFCKGNNDPAGSGCTSDERSYANDKPLYYDDSTLSSRPPDISGVYGLNLPDNNPASGYTVCTTTGGSSKKYSVDNKNPVRTSNCDREPGNPLKAIQATLKDLIALNPNLSLSDNIVTAKQEGTFAPGVQTTFSDGTEISTDNPPASPQSGYVVNVIDLGSGSTTIETNDNTPTTIQLKGNENSIFVFKKPSGNLSFGTSAPSRSQGVIIQLNGVEPNNVFWAIDGNIQWNALKPVPGANNQPSSGPSHVMKGTFISNGTVTSLKNVEIEGRLLGISRLPALDPNSTITAITPTGQPSLEPILQIHSSTGSPGNSPFAGSIEDKWLQVATTTTANAAFITGDSPSRPNPSESGGGLHNLVRFLENWSNQTARISGSFIQHKKSAYDSAPFNPVNPTVTDSLFYTPGNNPALNRYGSDTDVRYRGGESERRASFFTQPTRAYSFDVALLSQSPDLLAQKFTLNSTSRPNEYFREVGRDDSWIQTLLCAAQGAGTSYTYAIDPSERPRTCPSLTSYNDKL